MAPSSNSVLEVQAEIFKAVGHPVRLQIVKYLAGGERTVTEIVKAVGAEQSNVSRHLALLRQAGVLSSRKEGLKVFYRAASSAMKEALECVFRCAQELVRSRIETNESILARAGEAEGARAAGSS